MKKNSLLILVLLLFNFSYAQKIKVKTLAKLPQELRESSGLIAGENNTVWTHNDSGGLPILYQLDTTGKIIRKLYISGVKNTDWEDLANDYKGFVYIADIGNNCNCRKDLKILKIPHPDSLKTDTVIPEIISFEYENQTEFPPNKSELNFDAEALIAYKNSIYIFTKNRTKPYSQKTYIYAIINKKGSQKAQLKDSIYLKNTHKYHSWVTSATRNPYSDNIILISHKKAWIVKDFRSGNRKIIRTKTSGIYSQKEAITFDLEGNVWITNEKFKILGAKLKKGSFSD